MNVTALPLRLDFQGDTSLGAFQAALTPHADRRLVFTYAGRMIRPGYHVTEVKAGSFVTLDCGGQPDAWQETILQVEDLPASAENPRPMPVSRFLAILDTVGQRVALNTGARLTFEMGQPDEPMQVFDVDALHIEADRVVVQLGARPAVCKPRHRAQQQAAATCCAPKSSCC